MIDTERDHLSRENTYLKLRCDQLQEDRDALENNVLRLQRQLERSNEPRSSRGAPNPLSGGQ